MTLNQNDAELFYELWFPLLDYTNKKYKVNANLRKMHGVKELDPNEVKIVADYLWELYQPLHQIKHVLASKHWKLKVSSDESSS